jgi:hypothetical protein
MLRTHSAASNFKHMLDAVTTNTGTNSLPHYITIVQCCNIHGLPVQGTPGSSMWVCKPELDRNLQQHLRQNCPTALHSAAHCSLNIRHPTKWLQASHSLTCDPGTGFSTCSAYAAAPHSPNSRSMAAATSPVLLRHVPAAGVDSHRLPSWHAASDMTSPNRLYWLSED